MKTSKPLAIALAALTALALLTGAVAAPILCRPFYYAHIGPLRLAERTGYTEGEIKTAFDEMLDYCLGGEEFSTGAMRWSESGKSHFTDVRRLFLLDLRAFAAALAALACLGLLAGGPASGRGPGWGACSCWWAPWPRWTLTGPSWYSTPCSSPARTTGSSTPPPTRSSTSSPRRISATAPCSFLPFWCWAAPCSLAWTFAMDPGGQKFCTKMKNFRTNV